MYTDQTSHDPFPGAPFPSGYPSPPYLPWDVDNTGGQLDDTGDTNRAFLLTEPFPFPYGCDAAEILQSQSPGNANLYSAEFRYLTNAMSNLVLRVLEAEGKPTSAVLVHESTFTLEYWGMENDIKKHYDAGTLPGLFQQWLNHRCSPEDAEREMNMLYEYGILDYGLLKSGWMLSQHEVDEATEAICQLIPSCADGWFELLATLTSKVPIREGILKLLGRLKDKVLVPLYRHPHMRMTLQEYNHHMVNLLKAMGVLTSYKPDYPHFSREWSLGSDLWERVRTQAGPEMVQKLDAIIPLLTFRIDDRGKRLVVDTLTDISMSQFVTHQAQVVAQLEGRWKDNLQPGLMGSELSGGSLIDESLDYGYGY
ncbi:hypothetical protein FALBO_1408 [Fusarium albosuccineum]|uniref:Uncharacterized protein n=1 Tax=Fusarium albosuccineum TaxID=1237068 RepID=A0A8H4LLB7_9HYPO|nr:hypothetical protein FALBO_1408 [Fusarium albosuccineum]